MRYYFAPMEGITGQLFRQVHFRHFPSADRYYMPFTAPTGEHRFSGKTLRELSPETVGKPVAIPQLLTKNAQDFLWAAENLAELGFSEVNLNLGCPSGTVVAKGKGAGMLADPDALDAFLEQIFKAAPLPISVKTRLGMKEPEEFSRLLKIYRRYPICELTIHPRTREEYYRGTVHTDIFDAAAAVWESPLCYNGNLFSAGDVKTFEKTHPSVSAVMLGRGLLIDPQLIETLRGQARSRERLKDFHNDLCAAYLANTQGGTQNVLPRMKELWFYLIRGFEDTGNYEKQLKKAARWDAFYALTQEILTCAPLREQPLPL